MTYFPDPQACSLLWPIFLIHRCAHSCDLFSWSTGVLTLVTYFPDPQACSLLWPIFLVHRRAHSCDLFSWSTGVLTLVTCFSSNRSLAWRRQLWVMCWWLSAMQNMTAKTTRPFFGPHGLCFYSTKSLDQTMFLSRLKRFVKEWWLISVINFYHFAYI